MHRSTETLSEGEKTGEAGHQLTTLGSGSGTGRTRARPSSSTPRRPGAVLGNDPVPTGGGGSGSWACCARTHPARSAALR